MIFERDHYKVLGISKTASADEIRQQYKKLVLKFHPDRNKSIHATEILNRLNESYAVLSNPEKKQAFDLRSQNHTKRASPQPEQKSQPKNQPPRAKPRQIKQPRFSFRQQIILFMALLVSVGSLLLFVI